MSKEGKQHKSKKKEVKASSSSKKSHRASSSANGTQSSNVPFSSMMKASSAFETMYPVLNLPIPPIWSNDPYSAFSDLMDTLVMRYVPQLSGVLITHTPTRFLQDTAVFSADSAFATASVGFECVVWRPKIGQVLEGTICLSSPSHVSMLLYGLFNASIPASHLPEEDYEFVLSDADPIGGSTDQGLGHWRKRSSGSKLGGSDGKVTFTVISLTIANHMLSLHGSLLSEPLKEPPPTFDRSYLRKSLMPSEALGLGSSISSQPQTSAQSEEQPTSTPVRRVRWQDEDSRSSDIDDFPESEKAVTTVPGIEAGRDASKRKSKNLDSVDSSTPNKKRRKES